MAIRTTKKTAKKKAAPKKKAAVKKAVVPKKVAPKKAAPKKKVSKKAVSKQSPSTAKMSATPEEHWKMVAVAAYYKAQARGFAPGYDQADWLEAEREIDAFLS